MKKNLLLLILIILVLYLVYKRNFGYFSVKKYYKKEFDFNNNNYRFYDFITRNTIIPSSDVNNYYLFDKFNINKNDVLLDIGCGNCFNLLNLNRYLNFKKLIGIDIDIHNIKKCKKNLSLINENKFNILNKNAITYNIPTDVNYIYMYNPFQKNFNINYKIDKDELEIYKKVIKNIKISLKKKYRKIKLIFLNINPSHDKNLKILELLKKNFNMIEMEKYKYNNIFSNMKYAIFSN